MHILDRAGEEGCNKAAYVMFHFEYTTLHKNHFWCNAFKKGCLFVNVFQKMKLIMDNDVNGMIGEYKIFIFLTCK